ncbi:MAG: VCBS repeat-containing protein, partial [Akkermansiaceae bacterium]|nr:VCBS repeat-containing protein [Verrucomicrobiales bacterium]
DVNADGDPDFLGSGAGSLNVRLANGAGGFLANQQFPGGGKHINVGDVDDDGDDDVVTTDYGAVPTVFYNTGAGSFPTNATFNPRIFPNGVYGRAALGDLSGDGRADAVVPSIGQTITAYISGQAAVTLAHTMTEPPTAPFYAGGTVASVLILDVNADGWLDVVAAIGSGISVMLGEAAY